MGQKKFTAGPNSSIAPCPKCGNNTEFVAHSAQVSEDCCEVWVSCKCGYDPTAENSNSRLEDVWGTLDKDTIIFALDCSWNEPIIDESLKPINK